MFWAYEFIEKHGYAEANGKNVPVDDGTLKAVNQSGTVITFESGGYSMRAEYVYSSYAWGPHWDVEPDINGRESQAAYRQLEKAFAYLGDKDFCPRWE